MDLAIAIAVMSLLSLVAGLATGCCLYSPKGQRVILGLTCSVFAAVYFLFYASGQLFWAKYIPNSAAIIYSNFACVFAAMAAGWAFRLPNTPRWRRLVMVLMLGGMSLAATTWPLLSLAVRPPPIGGDEWQRGVAMQTSWATCSPAAAATLFNAIGIQVSEAELIPLCLTDASGTPTLGLYRGIKLVSDSHGRTVRVLDMNLQQLMSADQWPVLLAVELPYGVDDRRYVDQWGWIPGMGHSVVALERLPNGDLLIGDPSVGLERWSEKDMQILWHGVGMHVSQ